MTETDNNTDKAIVNNSKEQNRFFVFFKAKWQKTRLFVKSFIVAVFILLLLNIMQYVALYLYFSSGGLSFFARHVNCWVSLGIMGFIPFLHLWALICLIISVINIKRPTNIAFTILRIILSFTFHCSGSFPTVSGFFGQPDKDIIRYYAHNMAAIEKLNMFSQEIQSLSTDEEFTFTKESINDLSEKRSYDDKKYVFYYPYFDFNKNLLGMKANNINPDSVLLFQSDNDKSLFSNSNNISPEWHYGRGSLIVFVDGRLKFIKKENFKSLRWEP